METRLDDAETDEAPSEQPIDKNLPPVDLTADLMYRILLADIARQRGNDAMALSALVDSAKTTRDPRLAAQATRQAISMAEYEVRVDRYGEKPSLQYMLQESVMLHGLLDELNSLAFEVDDIEEEKRLIRLLENDAIERAREKLPARPAQE